MVDIDGRHLLRLGQGETDLDTTDSYSFAGREAYIQVYCFYGINNEN